MCRLGSGTVLLFNGASLLRPSYFPSLRKTSCYTQGGPGTRVSTSSDSMRPQFRDCWQASRWHPQPLRPRPSPCKRRRLARGEPRDPSRARDAAHMPAPASRVGEKKGSPDAQRLTRSLPMRQRADSTRAPPAHGSAACSAMGAAAVAAV